MSGPTVSVLVPSYNKAPYIAATLQSVYEQSRSDWELIVVDDGSTDDSPALLREHEARARVIYGDNRGASAARQRALGEARGVYVQYLDADDLLLPEALAQRVEALELTGADVAYSDWQRFHGNPPAPPERGDAVSRRMEDVHADGEVACFTDFWSPPVALLYRRTLLDRMPPWNEGLPVIQDARYLLEAAMAGGRFVHVPGVTALYRDDVGDSLSRRDDLAFVRDVARNADEVEALWRARGELPDARLVALADVRGYVARVAFSRDSELFDASVERLRELGQLRPTSWPAIAARLRGVLGTRAAEAVLSALGRPPS